MLVLVLIIGLILGYLIKIAHDYIVYKKVRDNAQLDTMNANIDSDKDIQAAMAADPQVKAYVEDFQQYARSLKR